MSTEGQNTGFPYFPHNLHISSARWLDHGVTVMSRELPHNLIDHVEVNDAAHNRLEGDQKRYATADWLRSHARLSTERGDAEGKNILTPFWCGRVIPVEYGSYFANGLHYGVISQKGGLVSGVPYLASRHLQTNDFLYPYGLFPKRNADLETGASNLALEYGMRSSMVLGTVILNPHIFEKWIETTWAHDIESQRTLTRILASFTARGDVPALMFRMNSQLARVTDPNIDTALRIKHTSRFTESRTALHVAQQRIGFTNWLTELSIPGNVRMNFVEEAGMNIPQIVAVLDKLAYSPLGSATDRDLQIFLVFYAALVTQEKKLAKVLYKGHFTDPLCSRVLNILGREKDMEPSFVRTDYETDPGDSDNTGAMRYGTLDLGNYSPDLNDIVDHHVRTLKHFFIHLRRCNDNILDIANRNGIPLSGSFIYDW